MGSRIPDRPEIEIDPAPWSPAAEVEALATADVGLTPLADDGWSHAERGYGMTRYRERHVELIEELVRR